MIELNDENYNQEISLESIVIVDFWAPWCGPCRILAPIFEKVSQKYEGKVKFAKFNTEEGFKIPSILGITALPTVVIYKNGTKVDEISGVKPEKFYCDKLEELLV